MKATTAAMKPGGMRRCIQRATRKGAIETVSVTAAMKARDQRPRISDSAMENSNDSHISFVTMDNSRNIWKPHPVNGTQVP